MFKENHLSSSQRKYMKVKNIIGRALGGIGLVVLSPVYLAIIVAIKKATVSGKRDGRSHRDRHRVGACLFFAEKSRNP